MTTEYEIHPAAMLFPMFSEEKLRELSEDIKANGQKIPIILYQGKILDGRNRHAACLMANVRPQFKEDSTIESPVQFVVSTNLHRRHLTTSQCGAIAAEAAELLRDEAHKRQRFHGGTAPGKKSLPPDSGGVSGEAVKVAAQQFGVGKTTVQEAIAVKRDDPEMFEQVKRGEITVNAAKRKLEGKVAAPTKAERVEKIRELSVGGSNSEQIAKNVGVSAEYVRLLARQNEIKLADEVTGKSRRIDLSRMIGETVLAAQGLAAGMDLWDGKLDGLNPKDAEQWADSLADSIGSLRRLLNQLRGVCGR